MIEKLDPKYIIFDGKMEMAVKLVGKINELIEAVNRMEKQIERLQVQ